VQPQAKRLAAGQDVSNIGAAGYGWFAEEKYHNTQVEIIKSRDVTARVAERIDLAADPFFEASPEPLEAFRHMIQVVPRRETGLIEISISGSDPDRITQWVNAVSDAYVERNIYKARANVSQAIDEIRKQMDRIGQDVTEAESSRFRTLSESEGLNTEDQEEIVREKLKTFNAELTKVQLELNRMRDTLGQIRDMPSRGADVSSIPALSDDPELKEVNRSRVLLERELEAAKVDMRPGHPEFEKKQVALTSVEDNINSRISVILSGLQTRFNLAKQQQSYLKQEITFAEELAVRVARTSSNYEMVKTQSESKKRVLDLIHKTMSEVQLGADLLSNNVSILDTATAPLYPYKPNKRVNIAIGAVLGLFLGLAAAFFLDYLDNTFRTPEDIEKYLETAVLGVIPSIQDETGLGQRAVKEAYQSLRTSIIFSSKSRTRKVILITSTGPQEGKSSTVTNLGRTLAAAGDRVAIIDCDLRRPVQHLMHDLDRDHGVTNYLAAPVDQTEWAPYALPSDPASLHIMTSGPIPPSPPELLGSERFSGLLEAMREHYDWILIDSPPAASLADSSLLATLADMMVLVVRYNRTDRDLVIKTAARLRSVNPNFVGAILNNVDLSRAYNKDYYYAGHYYESEDGEGTVDKKKTRSRPKAHVG